MKAKLLLVFSLVAFGCFSPVTALAVEGQTSSITYVNGSERWVQAFIAGDDGKLKVNRFNGTSWSWMDHGLPAGATSIREPTALTYVDAAGNRRIYVFALMNNHRLVVRYWNGSLWQWANQGDAPFVSTGFALGLSATTIIDAQGNRRIYAFFTQGVSPSEGGFRLVTNYWDGSSWHWQDLTNWQPGDGNGSSGDCRGSYTTAVGHASKDGQRKVEVFCAHYSYGTVFKHSWSDNGWVRGWTDVSLGGNSPTGTMSSVAFFDASGDPQVHVFTRSTNDELRDNRNGSWINLGSPPQLPGGELKGISAIAWTDSGGGRRIQVFAQFNNRLFARSANGFVWGAWTDQGLPAGPSIGVSNPSAVTWFDSVSGTQRIQVFTTGTNGEIYLNYWNGNSWNWLGHGNPP